MLLASVTLWRKHHREDTCILYADDMTIDLLDRLKVLELWHEIRPIPNSRKINKSVFWASAKLQVLADINEPIIIMDNDTHIYKPIKHLLDKETTYVFNYEIGKGYYPGLTDEYVRKISYKARWKTDSVNVSFLYLPNPEFTKRYAETSLQMMEEFTEMNVPNPQYLIFAEQLLLRHMMDKEGIEHRSLLATYWDCANWDWGPVHEKGLYAFPESDLYFKHYGPLKSWIKDNRSTESYDAEIIHLLNCINIPNLDLSLMPRK